MKKLLVYLLCIFVMVPVTVFAEGNLRHSILVSKFENRSNWSGQWQLADTFGTMLTDNLQQTNKFIVLGEKDRRQLLSRTLMRQAGLLAGKRKHKQDK
ncbi:MAG: hypothetical protein JSW20_08300 [Nitrospiraceae bacterium]|nr:MAG: hypothetical protein JSW20_08300 [Nitrospiraceae bacterium]